MAKRASIDITSMRAAAYALQKMQMKDYIKPIVQSLSKKILARCVLQPAEMGATPGTKGLSSSGNVPTPGRSYWKRGFGNYYVPYATMRISSLATRKVSKSQERAGKNRRAGRKGKQVKSQDLSHAWKALSKVSGMQVEVKTFNNEYADFVQGGAGDRKQQSKIMQRRGWESVDKIADEFRQGLEARVKKLVVQSMKQFLASQGFTV